MNLPFRDFFNFFFSARAKSWPYEVISFSGFCPCVSFLFELKYNGNYLVFGESRGSGIAAKSANCRADSHQSRYVGPTFIFPFRKVYIYLPLMVPMLQLSLHARTSKFESKEAEARILQHHCLILKG
jgi:hypothetical protein